MRDGGSCGLPWPGIVSRGCGVGKRKKAVRSVQVQSAAGFPFRSTRNANELWHYVASAPKLRRWSLAVVAAVIVCGVSINDAGAFQRESKPEPICSNWQIAFEDTLPSIGGWDELNDVGNACLVERGATGQTILDAAKNQQADMDDRGWRIFELLSRSHQSIVSPANIICEASGLIGEDGGLWKPPLFWRASQFFRNNVLHRANIHSPSMPEFNFEANICSGCASNVGNYQIYRSPDFRWVAGDLQSAENCCVNFEPGSSSSNKSFSRDCIGFSGFFCCVNGGGRASFGVIGGLLRPVGGAPSSKQSAAANRQSKASGYKRPQCPVCRFSSGVCGFPLSAKIALTIVLAGLATAIWSRSYWLFLDGRSNPFQLSVWFLVGLGVTVLNFLAVAWTG